MPPDPQEIRRALLAKAAELGLDRVAICAADLPDEARRFDDWLGRSFHAGMSWMANGRDRRMEPERLMRGLRSFVVAALAHPRSAAPAGPPGPPSGGPRGRVARFALGEDYHRVLGGRLRELAAFLRGISPGDRALEYVDTGAILERMWAAQAGIGWIGKNAMVLNREMGSQFSLGLILTTLELPPDEPSLDQCGACTLCIEACPTGAIVEPRVVDSRRCVSYHTIELRGPLPEEFREPLGDRILGCDDCQDVCPWNRDHPVEGAPETPSESAFPLLEPLLDLGFEAWDVRFRRSAVRRATWTGLRRNAIAALGNARVPVGDNEETASGRLDERLESLAADGAADPVLREQAAWSLERRRRRAAR